MPGRKRSGLARDIRAYSWIKNTPLINTDANHTELRCVETQIYIGLT